MALATNVAVPGLSAARTASTADCHGSRVSDDRSRFRCWRRRAGLKGVQAAQPAPTISTGGVVTLYGTVNIIQPGAWVSIYGTNLAAGTAVWGGDFPTTLGGTSVTINGKPAYLSFVSPGQINLQAPDDTATGAVSVVVTTSAGSRDVDRYAKPVFAGLRVCSMQGM